MIHDSFSIPVLNLCSFFSSYVHFQPTNWTKKLDLFSTWNLHSNFLKLFNFTSAAPYDEIAYQIRQSRGLPQPWQAEEKFGKKDDLQPQPDQVAAEAVVVDPSESVETSLLGFVTHVELTERVTNKIKNSYSGHIEKQIQWRIQYSFFSFQCYLQNFITMKPITSNILLVLL